MERNVNRKACLDILDTWIVVLRITLLKVGLDDAVLRQRVILLARKDNH
jgi:hypothetical protein